MAGGKKKKQQKEVKLSKCAYCGICLGFVLVSVFLGGLISVFMDEGGEDEGVNVRRHGGDNEERGFSAGESGLPGLNDPIFEVRSDMAHDPLNGTTVRYICTGGHYTAALDATNHSKAYIWGLLTHNARVLESPSRIEFPMEIAEIACGSFQLLFRTVNGSIFSAGESTKEMCDLAAERETEQPANDTQPYLPVLVKGLEEAGPIVQMAAGFNMNTFLTADGKLYFQGVKRHGPFKTVDPAECYENVTLAPLPPGMDRIRSVSAGSRYIGVLAEKETEGKTCTHVFFAGTNAFGAFGMNPADEHDIWVEAKLPESLYGCKANNEVVELSCGGDHALLRTQDNTVLGSGWNEQGQLGTHDKEDRHEFEPLTLGEDRPETAKNVVQIVAGEYSASLLIWDDGTVSSAGSVDMSGRSTDSFAVVKLPEDVRAIGVKKASSALMHAALVLKDDTIRLYGNAILGHVGIVIPREELMKRFGKRD